LTFFVLPFVGVSCRRSFVRSILIAAATGTPTASPSPRSWPTSARWASRSKEGENRQTPHTTSPHPTPHHTPRERWRKSDVFCGTCGGLAPLGGRVRGRCQLPRPACEAFFVSHQHHSGTAVVPLATRDVLQYSGG